MNEMFLLLGTNLGDKQENLRQAKILISKELGKIIKESSIYQSQAWGFESKDDFLNQIIVLDIKENNKEDEKDCAMNLLNTIHTIESKMGRKRENVEQNRYSSRIIDIDILYIGNKIIDSPTLKIPHKHIQDRKFTLMPLAEIAANFIHPKLQKTNKELLMCCQDNGKVEKI
jgi:2-amino-4-hydroxy-6-hydroxymethyldihydropteridine diphosphokinase